MMQCKACIYWQDMRGTSGAPAGMAGRCCVDTETLGRYGDTPACSRREESRGAAMRRLKLEPAP